MKTGLFCVAALSALELAFAQPHRQHHRHAKRDVVTQIDYVTATAPDVVIYVDNHGKPLYTSYAYQAPPTSVPALSPAAASSTSSSSRVAQAAPSSSSSSSVAPPAPSTTSSKSVAPAATSTPATTPAAAPTTAAAPSSSAPAPSSSAAAPASSSAPSSGFAISYSPYNADGTCKTQDQVNSDFQKINGYSMVRIYGTDCNQASTVLNAVASKGMKLFAGVYDITKVTAELQLIIKAANAINGGWAAIDTISIGNEGVNNGAYTVSAVVSAIGTARSTLSGTGFSGKIVTVDTFVAIIANPELCRASDYAAANCHAFFDGGVTAQGAGAFVLGQAQAVSKACGGKNTVITESGWPSQGNANGAAVPSLSNQKDAINSLKSHFSSNMVLFTAFNDMWKKNNAGTFGAEQYWGIIN
ncbi:Cell surface mannoprotein mp65 [Elasticomyces elasticus]|nr:Cell surface mannoprotein mp65 [Elasticomyces elasticus]